MARKETKRRSLRRGRQLDIGPGPRQCRRRCPGSRSKPGQSRRHRQSANATRAMPIRALGGDDCVLLGIRPRAGCPPPTPNFGLGTRDRRHDCDGLVPAPVFGPFESLGDGAALLHIAAFLRPSHFSRITKAQYGINRKEHIGYGLARCIPDSIRGGAVQPVRVPTAILALLVESSTDNPVLPLSSQKLLLR